MFSAPGFPVKIAAGIDCSIVLPELTKLDVTFSTKERESEVITKLNNLANADGEMEQAEKDLIDKIKSMM